MSKTIEGMTPEQICKAYNGKVHGIALSIFRRLPPSAGFEAADLVGFGHAGLLEASKKFKPGKGASFSTYADFRIRGSILDALRAEDSLSKWAHRQLRRIDRNREEAQKRLGRKATHGEVAALMGENLDRYWILRRSARRLSHLDLHSDTIRGRAIGDVVPTGETPLDDHLLAKERSRLVSLAFSELDERERSLLVLYYVDDLSLKAAGEQFGISGARTYQVMKKARLTLWRRLKNAGISSAA